MEAQDIFLCLLKLLNVLQSLTLWNRTGALGLGSVFRALFSALAYAHVCMVSAFYTGARDNPTLSRQYGSSKACCLCLFGCCWSPLSAPSRLCCSLRSPSRVLLERRRMSSENKVTYPGFTFVSMLGIMLLSLPALWSGYKDRMRGRLWRRDQGVAPIIKHKVLQRNGLRSHLTEAEIPVLFTRYVYVIWYTFSL